MPIKYVYPGNLSEKHPVQTRISILKRDNSLQQLVEQGLGIDTQISVDFKALAAKSFSRVRTTDTVESGVANIYLYTPASVSINDAIQYDNAEIGIIAGAMFSIAEESISQNDSSTETAIKTGVGFFKGAALAAITEGSKAAGLKQQLKLDSGVARNPRTEMLFKAPSLRQLSLTWKLMPTNQQESNTIFEMIKTMRAHSYPSTLGTDFAFTFPDIFQIDFITKSGGEAKMIKFAKAYCTSITTNYGASGPAFFKGGNPVEIDLTMTFQETEVQTRESIEEGF